MKKYALATLAIGALALGGSTYAAAAQEPANDQRPRLMQQRGPGQRGPGQQGPGFRQGPGGRRGAPGPARALRGLDLSEDQKAQVKALHEKLRADIEAVLTPEQLATLKSRRGGRGGGFGGER
ncbi:MAG: hypothetical protein AMXMBFR57_16190 [Acidimicrobiia bacterium]|jgi:Spy/CpxP family protein refolding chaperone